MKREPRACAPSSVETIMNACPVSRAATSMLVYALEMMSATVPFPEGCVA